MTENCPKLPSLRYGKVIVNGYGSSATAYYSCNYGYELDGAYSRKCQHDGSWYGKAPECRRVARSKSLLYRLNWISNQVVQWMLPILYNIGGCAKLDAPTYGNVWVTGNYYSSVAYYSCNHGYELDGAYSRKCLHDYTWDGKAPECRPVKRGNTIIILIHLHLSKIYDETYSTTVSCPKLVAPQYGQVWLSGDSYSSTAYYRCNYGYDLHGSHFRKCQHDGTWYGTAPECRVAKRSK